MKHEQSVDKEYSSLSQIPLTYMHFSVCKKNHFSTSVVTVQNKNIAIESETTETVLTNISLFSLSNVEIIFSEPSGVKFRLFLTTSPLTSI